MHLAMFVVTAVSLLLLLLLLLLLMMLLLLLLFPSVFADAETLFYHARYARTNRKLLSLEEILALLRSGSQEANQILVTGLPEGINAATEAVTDFGREGSDATVTREEWMVQVSGTTSLIL